MDAPVLKTPLPGPKAAAIIARDQQGRVAVLHARLSARHGRRRRRGRRGRGRQPVPRLRGRHRRQRRRATRTPTWSRPSSIRRSKYLHMSGTDFYYEPQVRLAEAMAEIVPDHRRRPHVLRQLGHRGRRGAVKLAQYHTKRFGIIAFLGSFHGRSMGSLSLTSSKTTQRRGFGPMMPGVYHAPYPNWYRAPVGMSAGVVRGGVPRLDRGADPRAPRLARRGRRRRRRVDPGRGRLHRPAGRVPPAAARADDEARHPARVPTKCSRAWAARGRCSRIEHFGVEPDIVAIAKGIASGMPLGVCCRARRRDGLAARRARQHVRRQPRLVRGGAGDDQAAARRRSSRTPRTVGAHLLGRREGADGQAPDHRRRARQGPDDRRRAGEGPDDQGARHRPSATRSSRSASTRACSCSARAATRSASRRR